MDLSLKIAVTGALLSFVARCLIHEKVITERSPTWVCRIALLMFFSGIVAALSGFFLWVWG